MKYVEASDGMNDFIEKIIVFWYRNQIYISIVFALVFVSLAFSRKKVWTWIVGILSTVMINFAFSYELVSLSSNIIYRLNRFLYLRGMRQVLSFTPTPVLILVRSFPFWSVMLTAWWIKRLNRGIKNAWARARAEEARATEEAKKQKIATVKAGIEDVQQYKLNILPFITMLKAAGMEEKEYGRFAGKVQKFVSSKEKFCRQLNADAEALGLHERTELHKA